MAALLEGEGDGSFAVTAHEVSFSRTEHRKRTFPLAILREDSHGIFGLDEVAGCRIRIVAAQRFGHRSRLVQEAGDAVPSFSNCELAFLARQACTIDGQRRFRTVSINHVHLRVVPAVERSLPFSDRIIEHELGKGAGDG